MRLAKEAGQGFQIVGLNLEEVLGNKLQKSQKRINSAIVAGNKF